MLERWLHNQGLEGRSDWPDVRRGRKENGATLHLMEHRRTLSRNKAFVPRTRRQSTFAASNRAWIDLSMLT